MTGAQKIAVSTAIGGFGLLSALLLIGLPAAHADELSDLRANEQLLQQRLDQLAKAQANEQQAAVTSGPVVAGAPAMAGSFPRSFLIPGTNTSIAITGYIKFDAAEWFHGGNPSLGSGNSPSSFGIESVASLPLNLKGPAGTIFATPAYNSAARSNFVFHDSAAQSRLRVETHTPTSYGEASTVLEFDFRGCSSSNCTNLDNGTFGQLPRLRLAYATLGGFFAGQGFAPVYDTDAHPDTLDIDPSDAGLFGFQRAPWIGYTWQLPYGLSVLAAAVTPETGFFGPLGGAEDDASQPTGYPINPTKTTMPDVNLVLKASQPWGHVQLGLVGQRLTLNDGAFLNQNFFGYGGGVSAHIKPGWFGWSRDNIGLNFYAGDGLGHYANPPGSGEPTTANALATNWGLVGSACDVLTGVGCYGNAAGGAGAVTPLNASLVRTQTILQYGAEANYQHFWTPELRSTISAGVQTEDIPTSLVYASGPDIVSNMLSTNANALQYNKTLITAHVNLVWSPVAFINTGFEFAWGHRLTILGATASEDVLDYAIQVKF
jgi:DcaP outer membrane protein